MVTGGLDEPSLARVLALVRDLGQGGNESPPISEQGMLRIRHRSPAATHLLVADPTGDRLLGYGLLTRSGAGDAAVLESAIAPVAPDRRAVLAGLLAASIDAAPSLSGGPQPTTLLMWSHGDREDVRTTADALGFRRDRVLLKMARPTSLPLPEGRAPDGYSLRSFRPGADDEPWVALNARAFATHPEQAYVTIDDLHERMAEPWFDPEGFLLAERADGSLAGFHWTKIHPDAPGVGEVYVIGVDPSAQGTGLGRALVIAGLDHLARQGLDTVILYADESNTGAVSMYERLGFEVVGVDAEYAHPLT